ncbi:MAG: prepilin-type N-terminal cleavage/methylation domain-containing protein, partial [Planctomycetes bacterium]|nr:prepilin-type N-terminal cleavage/methylation domain-containing protein [Planctomycetota bacterium]
MQSEPNRKEPQRAPVWNCAGVTMNRKRGFTLIELLVVIAIIA